MKKRLDLRHGLGDWQGSEIAVYIGSVNMWLMKLGPPVWHDELFCAWTDYMEELSCTCCLLRLFKT